MEIGYQISETPYTGGITKLRQYFEHLYYTLVVFKRVNVKAPGELPGSVITMMQIAGMAYLPWILVSFNIVLISGST